MRISLRADVISQFLDGGIQSLGGKHSANAQDHDAPFPAFKTEQQSGHNHRNGGTKMEPGVVLMAEQPLDSRPGIAE